MDLKESGTCINLDTKQMLVINFTVFLIFYQDKLPLKPNGEDAGWGM
jgi:hypothetical protein